MELKKTKITIITVSFNAALTIEQTILSIINQSFQDYEYIIIDGGSTDATVEIIKKYQDKITFWVSEPDKGIYDAMNKGVDFAKGKYIYFIGADDLLFDNLVLSRVSKYLINNNKIYYGNVLFKKRNVLYDGKFNSFKIVTRNISHQSIFYPKEIFDLYLFQTKYNVFADYELNLKLFNHEKYSFEYIPQTIALFNDEGVSGSNALDINFENDRIQIIKNNFHSIVFIYRIIRTFISKKL